MISQESMDLCIRIDALLKRAESDGDALYEFATENDEIIKNVFLARAIVRGLINPTPGLFEAIAGIEDEFYQFANEIEFDDETEDEEEDEEDEEEE